MRISYDPKVDALYIRLRQGKIEDSDEVAKGVVVDYDGEGSLLGIEIMGASAVLGGKREMQVELAIAEGKAQ